MFEEKRTTILAGTTSGCINHPTIEAVARCKQCGKPVCGACVVVAYNGHFCSDACQGKHAAFVERAQELSRTSRGAGFLSKVRFFLTKLVVFLLGFAALGFVCVYFQIPYAGAFFGKVYLYFLSLLP